MLFRDRLGVLLPVDAVRRVGRAEVEVAACEHVIGEGVAEGDVIASWRLASKSDLQIA